MWVKARPRITARATDWQGALDAICAAICEASGDGEPNLSFDPPEPVEGGDGRFALRDWLLLAACGFLDVDSTLPELFTGGFCTHCGAPIGERTDVPLVARGPAEGDLCWTYFFVHLPLLVSERLREALTPAERDSFRWIPVTPAPRTRKRYFECVPTRLIAPVAVRGWTISGTECPACGHRWVHCTTEPEIDFEGRQIHSWIAPDDLPSTSAGMLAFGERGSWLPLVPAERARVLAEEFRGVRPCAIGLAPADLADHKHPLPPQPKIVG